MCAVDYKVCITRVDVTKTLNTNGVEQVNSCNSLQIVPSLHCHHFWMSYLNLIGHKAFQLYV